MPKPYGSTFRHLIELEPVAWLEFMGISVPDPDRVRVIDSNLSTVTAESDKLLQVDGPDPFIVHSEFLSGRALAYPETVHWYNAMACHRWELPVLSVLVLLRPVADGPELTGVHEREVPGRGQNLWFRYEVIRVWTLPPERLLAGGLAVLPMAPVSDVPPERLPDVLRAVAERLRDEAEPPLRKTLWAATEILLSLCHPRDRVEQLSKEITSMILGIRGIEDSWLYQDIFAKGRAEGETRGRAEGHVEEAQQNLLILGRQKFGEPDVGVLAEVSAIVDHDRLIVLLGRLLSASSWDELLHPSDS